MKFQKTLDQDKILKAAKEKQIIKQLISKAEQLVWQQTFCWQHFQLAMLTSVSAPEDTAVMSSNLGEIVFNWNSKFSWNWVRGEQTHFQMCQDSGSSLPILPFLRSYLSTSSSDFLKYLFTRSKSRKVKPSSWGGKQRKRRKVWITGNTESTRE